jgi:fructokinase
MIVVTGEALIDLFVSPAGADGMRSEPVRGGSNYNVALGLARLGRDVAFLASISKDAFGDFLAGPLLRDGVDTRWLRRGPEKTTISVVATSADGHPTYSFYGDGCADRALLPADIPAAFPPEVNALVLGCFPLAVEPIATTLEWLTDREAGRLVVSLDPNLRPRLIEDMDAWRPRFRRFVSRATILKTSVEDMEPLYGTGPDLAAIARDLLSAGPKLVVFTRGPDGAVAFTSGGAVVDRPGRRVEVIDTVGAGDSFHAALLAHLDRRGLLTPAGVGGLDAEQAGAAVDEAIAASALTCTRRGADLPTASDLAASL